MSTFGDKLSNSLDGVKKSVVSAGIKADQEIDVEYESKIEREFAEREREIIEKFKKKERAVRAELAKKEREINDLKSKPPLELEKVEMKMLSLQLPVEYYSSFKDEVLDVVGSIYNPNRLGHHKVSHNQFIRALFIEMMVRLDMMDLESVNDEEDIKSEVAKLFKDIKDH